MKKIKVGPGLSGRETSAGGRARGGCIGQAFKEGDHFGRGGRARSGVGLFTTDGEAVKVAVRLDTPSEASAVDLGRVQMGRGRECEDSPLSMGGPICREGGRLW